MLPVDRDGAGYEDTGDHIEGDKQGNKLGASSRDHRDKSKTDEEDETAVRGVWLRWAVRPTKGKTKSEAGAVGDGREGAHLTQREVFRLQRAALLREAGRGAWNRPELHVGED